MKLQKKINKNKQISGAYLKCLVKWGSVEFACCFFFFWKIIGSFQGYSTKKVKIDDVIVVR